MSKKTQAASTTGELTRRGRVFHVSGAGVTRPVDKWYQGQIFPADGTRTWRGTPSLDHDEAFREMCEHAATMVPPVTDLKGSMGQAP